VFLFGVVFNFICTLWAFSKIADEWQSYCFAV